MHFESAKATPEQVEAAVAHPDFSHARQGDGCWRDLVWIYHRNDNSPTGVKLVLGADATVAAPIIRRLRNTSPLSPEERT